jgi:hypothetical protein
VTNDGNGRGATGTGETMSEQTNVVAADVTAAIEAMAVTPMEWKGDRCITAEMIDRLHGRPEGTARHAHSRHAERFVEGRHVHTMTQAEYCEAVNERSPDDFSKSRKGGYRGIRQVFTEKGYLLIAKVFDDARAWAVQEELIDAYFRPAARTIPLSEMDDDQFLETVKRTIEQKRAIEALKARTARLESGHAAVAGQLAGLLLVRDNAEADRVALPLSPEPATPKSPRSAVNEIVRNYALRTCTDPKRADFAGVWQKLWREFRLRNKIDLVARAKNARSKPLDIAERDGHMGDLWALASELFGGESARAAA